MFACSINVVVATKEDSERQVSALNIDDFDLLDEVSLLDEAIPYTLILEARAGTLTFEGSDTEAQLVVEATSIENATLAALVAEARALVIHGPLGIVLEMIPFVLM